MNRFAVNLMFCFMLALTVFVCVACGENQAGSRIPVDYEIEDVRNLPQDIGVYASKCPDALLGKTLRDTFLSEFRQKYYAPWTSDDSVSNVSRAVTTMKDYSQRAWYGENKRRVPGNVLLELLSNCDLEHLPSMGRPAVATAVTSLRVLPTAKPLFVKADDFPFDELQNTALKLNEPVRVLHFSRDGLWAFVEISGANGWVRSRDVGFIDKTVAQRWMEKAQVVVVKDGTLISDRVGYADQKVNVGTICPVSGEEGDSYEIWVAVDSAKHGARVVKARVGKGSAGRFPLEFDRKGIALIGNELIGKPYGWGEMYHDRDCSSMLRDFYLPFGIWLPRGSYNQINSGGKGISLQGLSDGEKERMILEKGVPFLTLVHMKGHITLYAGAVNGRPLVFQDVWGLTLVNGAGGTYKYVIGKSIVSTLTPGSELHPVGYSLLDRVSSMLVLSDRFAGKPAPLRQATQDRR